MNQTVNLKSFFGFGDINSLAEGVGRLMMPAFTIAGLALIFFIVFGAFKFLTSAGDKNAIADGRNMIIHAIIGFILLMMLFLVLQFLPQVFGIQWSLIAQ